MEISKKWNGSGIVTLAIDGELDASSALQMDSAIKEAFADKQYKILVNCEDLRYISSAGLGVFISHLEDFEDKDGRFIFYGMNKRVYNVFELLGLHQIFRIVESEADAQVT